MKDLGQIQRQARLCSFHSCSSWHQSIAEISRNCLAYIFPTKLNLLEIMEVSWPWGLLAQNSMWLRLELLWASTCVSTTSWGQLLEHHDSNIHLGVVRVNVLCGLETYQESSYLPDCINVHIECLEEFRGIIKFIIALQCNHSGPKNFSEEVESNYPFAALCAPKSTSRVVQARESCRGIMCSDLGSCTEQSQEHLMEIYLLCWRKLC